MSSDLLEGFEQFGKQLNLPQEDEINPKVDDQKGPKASSTTSSVSRWKSALNSVAKQVSQVAIRETMVLPNCESACIPWMLAEKDDWVPRKVAPFIWLNQEAVTDNNVAREALAPQLTESKAKENSKRTSSSPPESKHQQPKVDSSQPKVVESVAESSASSVDSSKRNKSSQDLTTPLLTTDEPHEADQLHREESSESQSLSRSLTEFDRRSDVNEENDSRPKKIGRRARMLDLGKKMGEKFEEKRRNIEEKSRSFVERMKGP
ncbi:hypothetical protein COLO4_22901 [Corchorus olitorius]|uniref:Uncharacterized protein n=1 Tax=Corchorus olitorius TaxID=93759 RepID=A0A1R3IJ92_9ROSI|nr:hypothetical protein COLO4_22901 [Corchorus olitorius]